MEENLSYILVDYSGIEKVWFLKIGIVTRNSNSWSSKQLQGALIKRNILHACFNFSKLIAQVGIKPYLKVNNINLIDEFKVLIIRPIGRGSVEELVFRMDMLYKLERLGLCIINPPEAIEHCVDKYDVLTILEENDIPVPQTMVTESVEGALKAFDELGRDVVVKPIFGSRGIGSTRVVDREIALTIFKAIRFHHGVIYLQKFVPHGYSDIRAFVVGDSVIAAMRRVANNWKTNYSQGAQPISLELDEMLNGIAVKSSKILTCKIAGVDILESPDGPLVVDVNSQPGWRGLQSVTRFSIAEEIIDFILCESKK